jgi:hypothetical protein
VADPSLIINTMMGQNDNYLFMQYLIQRQGAPDSVLLDRSHLSQTPLDTNKIALEIIRKGMSHPYALLLMVVLVFVFVVLYVLKKEELIG